MKHVRPLLAALVLLTVSAYAQTSTTIDGAMGLKWGASSTEIRKAMSARPGIKLYSDEKDNALSTTVRYQGGSLANMPVILTSFSYADEGLYRIAIAFADGDDTGESKYQAMLPLLREKYGPGVADPETPQLYKWTMSDGNTVELQHSESAGTTIRYYDQGRFTRYIRKKMKLESKTPASDY